MRGKVAKPLLLTTLHVRARETEEKKLAFEFPAAVSFFTRILFLQDSPLIVWMMAVISL